MYQITNDVLFALQPVITSKQVYLWRFCTQPLTQPVDGCWNGKWSVSTNSYCFMCNKAEQSVVRRAACGECENHSSDWNHLNPSSSVHSFKKEMEAISPFCRGTDDTLFYTSGDVYAGFKFNVDTPLLCFIAFQVIDSSESPLSATPADLLAHSIVTDPLTLSRGVWTLAHTLYCLLAP